MIGTNLRVGMTRVLSRGAPTEDKALPDKMRLTEDKACLAKTHPPKLRSYTIKDEA